MDRFGKSLDSPPFPQGSRLRAPRPRQAAGDGPGRCGLRVVFRPRFTIDLIGARDPASQRLAACGSRSSPRWPRPAPELSRRPGPAAWCSLVDFVGF